MVEHIKFSVIIPIYNCKKFVEECLNSVQKQTYSNWECICVDDGSTDGSGDICDEYEKKDSRFRVIHKKNGGEGSARNAGLDVCSGDMVYFLDSDDVLNNQVLEVCAKGVALYPNVDLSSVKMIQYEDGESPKWNRNKDIDWQYVDLSEKIGMESYGMPVGSIAYKAELIRNVRFTNLKVGADRVFVYSIIEKAKSLVYSDYIGYGYRTRIGSIINSQMTSVKFLADLEHRMFFLDILLKTTKDYDSYIIKIYEKHFTEYMAKCFFDMPKQEQISCLTPWSTAMKKASAYNKFNWWYRSVMFVCATCNSRIIYWFLCYVPYWLKSHGVNRQLAVIKKSVV